MSAMFTPLQRAVIQRLGLQLMTRRDAASSEPMSAVEHHGNEPKALASTVTPTNDAALKLPTWASRAMRFIDAERIPEGTWAALPPRTADAKRALWRLLRKDRHRAP